MGKRIDLRRASPADLTPEQRGRYEARRKKANADIAAGKLGPPVEALDLAFENAAPFYFALRACVKQLKDAREAAGLTLAQVAAKSGLAEETLSRLETGAATNPAWKTLGMYAAAVGLELALTARPARKRETSAGS